MGVRRVIRYRQRYPGASVQFGAKGDDSMARMWTSSGLAGCTVSWRSFSGGSIHLATDLVAHWYKIQSIVVVPFSDMEFIQLLWAVVE